MVLCSQKVFRAESHGLGHDGDLFQPNLFLERLQRILELIRATGHSPFQFHRSQGFQVPRKDDARIVHSVSPFSKAYHKSLLRRPGMPHRQPPHHAFAVPGRRREEAILTKLVVSHRCAKARLSIANRHYDVVNAIASPSHDIMDESTHHLMLYNDDDVIDETAAETPDYILQQDERLLRQHHRHARCTLQAHDKVAEFYPESGAFQGNSVATNEFHVPYWRAIGEWSDLTRVPALVGRSPLDDSE
eukprot:6409546-Pyramimonas_sp.AAC.1